MTDNQMHRKGLSNWAKTMLVLGALLLLMLFPPTRAVLLFVLPLGSGIDDLIFFILLFVFITVAMIKLAYVDAVVEKLRNWFSK